jgi:hypothetical protein
LASVTSDECARVGVGVGPMYGVGEGVIVAVGDEVGVLVGVSVLKGVVIMVGKLVDIIGDGILVGVKVTVLRLSIIGASYGTEVFFCTGCSKWLVELWGVELIGESFM